MRLGRKTRKPAAPSEFIASSVVATARSLDEAAGVYRALLREEHSAASRATARVHARRLAMVGRGTVLFARDIVEEVPEEVHPFVVLNAVLQLECAFVALAQEERDEPTLLDAAELDALMGGEVEHWISLFREAWET